MSIRKKQLTVIVLSICAIIGIGAGVNELYQGGPASVQYIRTIPVAVSSLPACTSGINGATVDITDNLAQPVAGAIAAGSGTFPARVRCDGGSGSWVVQQAIMVAAPTPAPTPTPIPIVKVQSANNITAASTTTATAFASNPTAGNLLIAAVRFDTTTQTVAITDTKSNTWTLAVSAKQTQADAGTPPADAHQIAIYYTCNNVASGADTVTATYSSSNAHGALAVYEFSGVQTTNCLDQTSSGLAGSASSTVDSGTTIGTSFTHELYFGHSGYYWGSFFGGGGSPQVNTAAGYTTGEFNEGSFRFSDEYEEVSATGNADATWTTKGGTTTNAWSATVATFRGITGNVGATPPYPVPPLRSPGVFQAGNTFGGHTVAGDGTTDDTLALQAAVNAGDVDVVDGTYKIVGDPTNHPNNNGVFVPSDRRIQCRSTNGIFVNPNQNTSGWTNVFVFNSVGPDSVIGCTFKGSDTTTYAGSGGTAVTPYCTTAGAVVGSVTCPGYLGFNDAITVYNTAHDIQLSGNVTTQLWGDCAFRTYEPSSASIPLRITFSYNTHSNEGIYGECFDGSNNSVQAHNTFNGVAGGSELEPLNLNPNQTASNNVYSDNTITSTTATRWDGSNGNTYMGADHITGHNYSTDVFSRNIVTGTNSHFYVDNDTNHANWPVYSTGVDKNQCVSGCAVLQGTLPQ